MVKFAAVSTTVLGLISANSVSGSQDSYSSGYTNPNSKDDLYYREAVNVLQDLNSGMFEALYIRYHSCV